MKKILIIDDGKVVRISLEKELSNAGYSIVTAENGKQGVQKALEEMPDLILLDIVMPEMDGAEASTLLRKDPRTKNIPIIFATSLVKESDVRDGFITGSKGVDQYFIAKPFDMNEVLRLVHASIGEP